MDIDQSNTCIARERYNMHTVGQCKARVFNFVLHAINLTILTDLYLVSLAFANNANKGGSFVLSVFAYIFTALRQTPFKPYPIETVLL